MKPLHNRVSIGVTTNADGDFTFPLPYALPYSEVLETIPSASSASDTIDFKKIIKN